jgi:hypothetical protein
MDKDTKEITDILQHILANMATKDDLSAQTVFGAFDLCSRRFFWKIEYYDKKLEYGSDDPSDLEKTTRVLTLMLAEDY